MGSIYSPLFVPLYHFPPENSETKLCQKSFKSQLKSILKFEYIDSVKSKNINQNNNRDILELLGIDLFRDKRNYNISIYFKNNAFITLSSEILEVTLEDQSEQ